MKRSGYRLNIIGSLALVAAVLFAWWSARNTQNPSASIAAVAAIIYTVGGAITDLMNPDSTIWGMKWFLIFGVVFAISFVVALAIVEFARRNDQER